MELANVSDEKMFVQKKNLKNVVDKVPNEILRSILARFDVLFLISIRAVNKRWNVAIKDICDVKKSIVIQSNDSNVDIASISSQLNGLVDFSVNCAIITVKLPVRDSKRDEVYKSLSLTLVELFPRVQNVAIMHELYDFMKSEHFSHLLGDWSANIVTLFMPPFCSYPKSDHPALFDALNKLTTLKRLSFHDLDQLLPATIVQLVHCSICPSRLPRVLPRLGVDCFTSLCLGRTAEPWDITQLGQLGGLTRLKIVQHRDNPVVNFICDHFAALQWLDIHFSNNPILGHDFGDIISKVAKLPQLSTLSLTTVRINMDYLARLAKLPTLKSVQTFSLARFQPQDGQGFLVYGLDFNVDLFCRALSIILPSLLQLNIKHYSQDVREDVVQSLHHFTNLRKHKITAP